MITNPSALTVTRPARVPDARNNVSSDFGASTTHTIVGSVAPSHQPELAAQGRQGWPRAWELYTSLTADVAPFDRLTVDGVTYEVDSYPERWESHYGSLSGAVAQLKRLEG